MFAQFDILIVGGGMVGLTMAAALADSGLKIAVVEKGGFDQVQIDRALQRQAPLANEFDLRVSAISPSNQAFLRELGVWQLIPSARIADYELMQVWDGEGTGHIEFDAAQIAQPILGSIVENQTLRAALYRKLTASSNKVQLITQAEIIEVERANPANDQPMQVVLSDQSVLTVKLIIGADGAHSSIRELFSIYSLQQPYQQEAFVANVMCELPHQNTAWQRFLATGPLAFLPLPQANLCSIVWSVDCTQSERLKALSAQEFTQHLSQAFEQRLGELELVSAVRWFPLVKRHSERYLADGLVLIGDAAHTIHPLAGQGVNLGFQDVACLAQLLDRLRAQRRDFTLQANLRPYERERKAANALMQDAMSLIKWGFSTQSLGTTVLRNVVLNQLNQTDFAKNLLIRHAMGG